MSNEPRLPVADIITALERPFPPHAIKQRDGGGSRKFDYVETQTVIRRLNEATQNNWSYHITRLEWHGELLIATGELTIPGLGTRSGTGVQKVHERGGEDLVKGAASDALKNCARLFGVGLDLYGPDLESGEVSAPRNQGQKQPPTEPQRMTQLDVRLIADHASKHKVNWRQVVDYAHGHYDVDDVHNLTKAQGRELHRWISEQGRLRELNPTDEELAATSGARP